uniref:Zinc finger PHD-type domain-containing protein n=1 Tax=Homalodisca liturata TaxID=320908 RepID=A0A1B6K2E9_9HEMI
MVCGKCQLNTSNAKEVAKCSLCSVEFHATCCRIRTVAKLLKMSAKALTTWRCDECDVDGASSTNSDDPIIMDLLKNIKQEMLDSRKSNSASFASLEKTMTSVRDSLEEVKLKLSTVEKDNLTLKEDCGLLKKENQRLAENVSQLKTEIDELQQRSRLNNIEIRGVPVTKGEDIYAVVESIAKAIGVVFNRGGISIAHRLPAPRDRRFHPSIVVQFISRSIRGEWLIAARKNRIETTDLAPSLQRAPVFISEHLTAHNKSILGRAKAFVKFGKLAYAWSREGRIMVRKTADSPAERVSSFEDIERAAASPSPSQNTRSTQGIRCETTPAGSPE